MSSCICYLGLSRWPDGSGDPRIFQKQMRSLAEAGFNVVTLTSGEGPPYSLHGFDVRPMGWAGGLASRLEHLVDVYAQGRGEEAAIYVIGNAELIPVALLLKCTTRARIVYDAMEDFPEMIRVSRQLPLFARESLARAVALLEDLSAPLFDLVLAADEPTAARLRRRGRAEVIFNFPRISVLDALESSLARRLEREYAGRRIIVYVGGLFWDRGLREMARAMALVRKREPKAMLMLLGFWQVPGVEEEFRALLAKEGLLDAVRIHGGVPQEELGVYLRCAEIGIALLEPSEKHQRNIATKQFDYMCCGIPVVANDLAPFRAFTGRANAGILTPSWQPEEVAAAILALLENPERARALGANGRRAVESGWNWEGESRRLVSFFREMLPPRRQGPERRSATGQ